MKKFVKGDAVYHVKLMKRGIVFMESYEDNNIATDGVWIMFPDEPQVQLYPFAELKKVTNFGGGKRFTKSQLQQMKQLFDENDCLTYCYETISRFGDLILMEQNALSNILPLDSLLKRLIKEKQYAPLKIY